MNLFSAAIWPASFYLFSCLQWLHLKNSFYFVWAGLNVLSGYQATQYLALCYAKDTIVRIEFEFSFVHIGESFHKVYNIRSFLACYHNVVVVREYISTHLILQYCLHHSAKCEVWVTQPL
jgi:hypothetical protein